MKKTLSILVLLLVGFSGNVFALDISECIKIKDDAKILDVGCGAGAFIEHINKY